MIIARPLFLVVVMWTRVVFFSTFCSFYNTTGQKLVIILYLKVRKDARVRPASEIKHEFSFERGRF